MPPAQMPLWKLFFDKLKVSNITLGACPVFFKPTCHFSQWQQERLKKTRKLMRVDKFLLLTL